MLLQPGCTDKQEVLCSRRLVNRSSRIIRGRRLGPFYGLRAARRRKKKKESLAEVSINIVRLFPRTFIKAASPFASMNLITGNSASVKSCALTRAHSGRTAGISSLRAPLPTRSLDAASGGGPPISATAKSESGRDAEFSASRGVAHGSTNLLFDDDGSTHRPPAPGVSGN